MRSELRGTRYLNPSNQHLVKEITDNLRFCDYDGTMAWYCKHVPKLTDKGRAFLACNDRYFLLTGILHRSDALHPWLWERCRQVEAEPDGHIDLWARYHYKDQAQETDVLTVSGWKKHGDLVPGDWVFSPSGRPVKVLATKHFTDSACRRVTFDNDVSFVCGAGHLWTVEVSSRERIAGTKRRKSRRSVTLETDALALLRSTYRPVVRATCPLAMPHVELPIDPYALGAWLGDGTASTGEICGMDPEVFASVEAVGYHLSRNRSGKGRHPEFRYHTIYGLRPQLRRLGVLGNKHIPEIYMMASIEQRVALLQGLIDTDGSASPDNGCITFAQTNKKLAEQVQTLACGLGFKARLTPVRAGTGSWHVVFQASREQHPCRIVRKLDALPPRPRRIGSQGWRVHTIEAVETVPTNCIQVDSPDGLYLVGRELIPTHNSTIITFAGAIQEIVVNPEIKIGIFSVVKPIAQEFLAQIKEECENNETLKQVFSDVFYQNPRGKGADGRPAKWSVARGITVKRRGIPKEATIEAHGLLDGQPTGRHFDLHIYDDIVNQDHINDEQIKKTTLRYEMADNLGTHWGVRKWVVGTRYHFADTYQEIIERKSLIPRVYSATDDGTLNGKPVFLTQERWKKIKVDQRSVVSAQMLLNPIAGNEATFRTTWLKTYDVIPSILNVYIMCDPSKGRSARSDRTAIAVIGIDLGGNKYLLDGYCHRMKLSERWQHIKELEAKWSTHYGVQNVQVGYEQYGMQSDLEVIEDLQEREKRQFRIEELGTPSSGSHAKPDRIGRLEPDLREGRLLLPIAAHHPDRGGNGIYAGMAYWAAWTEENEKRFEEASKALGADKSSPYNVGQIIYTSMRGLTSRQRYCEETLQRHRIVRPIKRRDENGDIYDVTRHFISEVSRHPFAAHDDFLDACSRIYDMKPAAPVQLESDSTEPLSGDDYQPQHLDS